MAAVLSEHLPRLLSVYHYQEARLSEPRPAGESSNHLQMALAMNEELRTKIGPFLPNGDFERTEAEAHAFMGLAEGMRGNIEGVALSACPCGGIGAVDGIP